MKNQMTHADRKPWTTPVCVDCDKTTSDVNAAPGPGVGFDGGGYPSSYATS